MNIHKTSKQIAQQISKEYGGDRRRYARWLRKNGVYFDWREPAQTIDDRPRRIELRRFETGDSFDGWYFNKTTWAAVISFPGAADPYPHSTTYYSGYSRLY